MHALDRTTLMGDDQRAVGTAGSCGKTKGRRAGGGVVGDTRSRAYACRSSLSQAARVYWSAIAWEQVMTSTTSRVDSSVTSRSCDRVSARSGRGRAPDRDEDGVRATEEGGPGLSG